MRALLVLLLAGTARCGEQYWWMDQMDVFSGSNSNNNNVGSGPVRSGGCGNGCGGANNYGPPQSQGGNSVQTECPAGTKCVGDYFCDENAIMVNYRVNLTPAQKRNRGDLIRCMNRQTNNLDNVCCSTAAGPLPINNGGGSNANLQGRQPAPPPRNNNFNSQSGSCPNVASLPDLASCNGAKSNCWSVGEPDVDCPNNEFCCFDGCRNACYFGDSSAAPQPNSPQFSNNRPSNNNQFRQPQPSNNNFQAQPSNNNYQPQPSSNNFQPQPSNNNYQPQPSSNNFQPSAPRRQQPRPSNINFSSQPSNQRRQPQPNNFQPSSSNNYQPQQPSAPGQQQSHNNNNNFQPNNQAPRRNPQPQRPNNNNFQGNQPNFNRNQDAEQKPYGKCPSAMKCVPEDLCNLEGVMVQQPVSLTPNFRMLRVALNACISPDGRTEGFCCRDPNYSDPWPEQQGGNNFNNNNQFRQQHSQPNGGGVTRGKGYGRK